MWWKRGRMLALQRPISLKMRKTAVWSESKTSGLFQNNFENTALARHLKAWLIPKQYPWARLLSLRLRLWVSRPQLLWLSTPLLLLSPIPEPGSPVTRLNFPIIFLLVLSFAPPRPGRPTLSSPPPPTAVARQRPKSYKRIEAHDIKMAKS